MAEEKDLINRLIAELKRLPGVGPRSAERLAFHVLVAPEAEAMALAHAIRDVKKKLRPCRECFNAAEGDLCAICKDPRRDPGVVCVVEQLRDLVAIERTETFHGRYHVLLGALSPLDGVGEEHLTLAALAARVERGGITEVILATNPTLEGDNTALCAWEMLRATGVKVTRLARGLASGGQIGYTSGTTVAEALEDRREFRR
ncbi:MAG TPA: recombination mediator RecR [Planctomycetota bacterium]|nr:recombination protein RecR [Planctomycetota bacterium]OQC22015.1 MAG: Recombination protein RecR [Planctomycetes bacterium ADurb.Bin069]HNR98102.1 recombination mediator RecR [Planctomycetota bacterium]HNU25535.1 recombination mediator RecR [Planctomycetota bacterium]HOE28595.1 recombination mediator RecR [Planctomycetota bacterium]